MTMGLFAALVLACAMAFRQPPALAFLAMFMPFESPGIGAVIVSFKRWLIPVTYIGYLLATTVVFLRLWRTRRTSREWKRLCIVGLLGAGISVWIALSTFATGGSKIEAVNKGMEVAPGLLFAITFYRSRAARCLLMAAITLHLVIGCGIILLPESGLAGLRRPDMAYATLPDVRALETTALKDSAQFQSAVQFAFYGAASLLIGVYLLLYRRSPWGRLFGAMLAVLGAAATFFTLERGIWFGILIGLLVLGFPLTRRPLGRLLYGAGLAGVVFVLWLVFATSSSPTLVTLREHFLAVTEDTYRIPVALRSVDILFAKPVFGVGGRTPELVELAGGAPHQSFYYYAVAYGVPAGIFSLMLTWCAVACNFRRWRNSRAPGFAHEDYYLARALGLVVVSMALTNGMSGGMLAWICLGFACIPWAYGLPRRKRVLFYPRFAASGKRPHPVGEAKVEW